MSDKVHAFISQSEPRVPGAWATNIQDSFIYIYSTGQPGRGGSQAALLPVPRHRLHVHAPCCDGRQGQHEQEHLQEHLVLHRVLAFRVKPSCGPRLALPCSTPTGNDPTCPLQMMQRLHPPSLQYKVSPRVMTPGKGVFDIVRGGGCAHVRPVGESCMPPPPVSPVP